MKTIHLVERTTAPQTLCGRERSNLDTRTQVWSTVTNWPTLSDPAEGGLPDGYEACAQCIMAKEAAGV